MGEGAWSAGILARWGGRLARSDVLARVATDLGIDVPPGPGGRSALEGRGGACARVITGGTIRTGDPVRVLVNA